MEAIEPNDKTDENIAYNYWENIFIPIRHGETRIQVIRNGEADLTDDELSELKMKLIEFEKSKIEESVLHKVNILETLISNINSKLSKKTFWPWQK